MKEKGMVQIPAIRRKTNSRERSEFGKYPIIANPTVCAKKDLKIINIIDN